LLILSILQINQKQLIFNSYIIIFNFTFFFFFSY